MKLIDMFKYGQMLDFRCDLCKNSRKDTRINADNIWIRCVMDGMDSEEDVYFCSDF